MRITTSVFMAFTRFFTNILCRKEYTAQRIGTLNERPLETAFLFNSLCEIWPSTILDVGSGRSSLPHLMSGCCLKVTAIDNIRDYWKEGMFNRHFHVIDDDILNSHLTESFDAISCISVLEHIANHRDALSAMYKLLTPGGHCILTFPYCETEYIPDVYALPDTWNTQKHPFVAQAFSRKEIDVWCNDNSWIIKKQVYWQFCTGDFWTCGERLSIPIISAADKKHQLSGLLIEKPI